MAIDIERETLIRLQDVRDHIPSSRKGKRLSKAIIFRWALKGRRGVFLETLKIGGGRFTSREALQRFILKLNRSDHPRIPDSKSGETLRKFGI